MLFLIKTIIYEAFILKVFVPNVVFLSIKVQSEAVARRCSVKRVFLKITQNSQNKPVLESFLLKKRLLHRCFPVNFAKF